MNGNKAHQDKMQRLATLIAAEKLPCKTVWGPIFDAEYREAQDARAETKDENREGKSHARLTNQN